MPLLTDLRELKTFLEIDPDDTQEDKKLNFLLEQATDWIAELLNRPGLFYKSRTEYYAGTNRATLLLRSRPVYTTPTIQVWVDEGGFFGSVDGSFGDSDEKTYGDDFALQIDQDDGTSRSGILVRIKGVWPRPVQRSRGLLAPYVGRAFGNVKVTYTAGYTVDTLPSLLRQACNTLVSKMRYLFPLGMELSSESYEERSISILGERKDYLLSLVKSQILGFRNWVF